MYYIYIYIHVHMLGRYFRFKILNFGISLGCQNNIFVGMEIFTDIFWKALLDFQSAILGTISVSKFNVFGLYENSRNINLKLHNL